MRLNSDDINKLPENIKKQIYKKAPVSKKIVKHKFHAIPTVNDDIIFDSKKEAKRYEELKYLKQAKEVLFFLRQVPMHLPGNTKYVLDFMVFWVNGKVTFEDVKGKKTQMYIMKKKQVEDLYPIKITEI